MSPLAYLENEKEYYLMSHSIELPIREGAHPEIGQEPPQLQFSDLGPEDVRWELKEWAFSTFPNVTEHDTAISVPTSRALWLDEKVSDAHEDALCPHQVVENFVICIKTEVFTLLSTCRSRMR